MTDNECSGAGYPGLNSNPGSTFISWILVNLLYLSLTFLTWKKKRVSFSNTQGFWKMKSVSNYAGRLYTCLHQIFCITLFCHLRMVALMAILFELHGVILNLRFWKYLWWECCVYSWDLMLTHGKVSLLLLLSTDACDEDQWKRSYEHLFVLFILFFITK